MKLAYKFKISIFLLSIALTSLQAYAGNDKKEFTKTIKKEFNLAADGLTSISNKYGKVNVQTWDKNRVKIEVRITVRASTEENAKTVFDRININFSETPGKVRAETIIESSPSNWSWSVWTSNSNKTDYSIDYDVMMPTKGRLDLSNKYGDSFISAIKGQATLDIKYGNFQLEGTEDNLSLYLGYGSGTVVKAKDVSGEGDYCQLRIKDAKDVKLNTKYSKIRVENAMDFNCSTQYDSYKIGEIRDLYNQGKYDNFEITHAENISFVSKYADIYVGSLSNSANLELKYGGATVEKLAKGFSQVNLDGNYADYKVRVEDGAVYHVDANANYAGIKYPVKLQVIHELEKGTSHQVSGYVGQKGARSVIKANLNYGGLKVW